MSVSERATARRAATTWAQHALIKATFTKKAGRDLVLTHPNAEGRSFGQVFPYSRCPYAIPTPLLVLQAGHPADASGWSQRHDSDLQLHELRAQRGPLGPRVWFSGRPPKRHVPRLVDRSRGIQGAVSLQLLVYRRRGSDVSEKFWHCHRPLGRCGRKLYPTYMLGFIFGNGATTSGSIMTAPRAPGVERASAP